jgi:hypothetical protein
VVRRRTSGIRHDDVISRIDGGSGNRYHVVMRDHRDLLATITISLLIGAAAAVVLVVLARPTNILVTGGCGYITVVQEAGFDPWTGQPQGQVTQSNCLGDDQVYSSPPPEELLGQAALPWGSFLAVVGALVGLGLGLVIRQLVRLSRSG